MQPHTDLYYTRANTYTRQTKYRYTLETKRGQVYAPTYTKDLTQKKNYNEVPKIFCALHIHFLLLPPSSSIVGQANTGAGEP